MAIQKMCESDCRVEVEIIFRAALSCTGLGGGRGRCLRNDRTMCATWNR